MSRYAKGKGVRLNYQQGRAVEELIRAHAVVVKDGPTVADHLVTYEQGWDDRMITEALREQIGEDLTVGCVRRFRANNIGKVAPGVKPGSSRNSRYAPLQEQIAVLTRRMEALEGHVRLLSPTIGLMEERHQSDHEHDSRYTPAGLR